MFDKEYLPDEEITLEEIIKKDPPIGLAKKVTEDFNDEKISTVFDLYDRHKKYRIWTKNNFTIKQAKIKVGDILYYACDKDSIFDSIFVECILCNIYNEFSILIMKNFNSSIGNKSYGQDDVINCNSLLQENSQLYNKNKRMIGFQ